MQGNFELGTPGWYTPQAVEENDFLNGKLETNQYGKWYSVQFMGDAETYLWMTKTKPEVDKRYWGQLEKTSSGKAVKFKKLMEPGNDSGGSESRSESSSSKSDDKYWSDRNEDIRAQMAVKTAAVLWSSNPKWTLDDVERTAKHLYLMVDSIKSDKVNVPQTEPSGYDPGADPANDPMET